MVSVINYKLVLKIGVRAVDSYLKSWKKRQAELEAMQKKEQSRRKQSYTIDNAIIEKIDINLYCYANKPPLLDTYSIYGSILHVPAGCKAAYENSDWKRCFSNIVEMN